VASWGRATEPDLKDIMTTKATRMLAQPRKFTEAFMAGSLSSYATELLRRLGQGWPLTLAEYVYLEESLAVSPSMNPTEPRQLRCMP
jgi:hypothetical protein